MFWGCGTPTAPQYDENGFTLAGIHRDTGTEYAPNGFNRAGYNAQGFNRNGFNSEGYDRLGFDQSGFNRDGVDADGFDRDGYHHETGFNAEGWNRQNEHANLQDPSRPLFNNEGWNRQNIHMDTNTRFNPDNFDVHGNRRPFYRYPSMDFTLTSDNQNPTGIWSDGTTMWIGDWNDDRIYAYNLTTGERERVLEFDTLQDSGNVDSQGMWSNGETLWVADLADNMLYAYHMPE